MLPFIVGGRDSVLLERHDELFPGMIVLAYVDGNRYVLHRIVSVEEEWITLMGDGNIKGVERCQKNDVKAVAVKVIKPNGEVSCLDLKHLRCAEVWKYLLPIRRWLLAVYKRLFI